MIQAKLHHVHIVCNELEEMISFFTDTLGGEFLNRQLFGGAPGARVQLGSGVIAIRTIKEEERVAGSTISDAIGIHHIGFEIEDVDKAYELLSNRYTFTQVPTNIPNYRIAFMQGPEKVIIEFMQAIA